MILEEDLEKLAMDNQMTTRMAFLKNSKAQLRKRWVSEHYTILRKIIVSFLVSQGILLGYSQGHSTLEEIPHSTNSSFKFDMSLIFIVSHP